MRDAYCVTGPIDGNSGLGGFSAPCKGKVIKPDGSHLNVGHHWSASRERPEMPAGPGHEPNAVESALLRKLYTLAAGKQEITGSPGAPSKLGGSTAGSPYRSIQCAYMQAFRKAGVEYKGTHAFRHGGTRLFYNQTKGLAVAGMLLGNENSATVKVYAKRDKGALNAVALEEWGRTSDA